MKDKFEKLVQNSYSNYICQTDNLRKEIENKDELLTNSQRHLTTSPTVFF